MSSGRIASLIVRSRVSIATVHVPTTLSSVNRMKVWSKRSFVAALPFLSTLTTPFSVAAFSTSSSSPRNVSTMSGSSVSTNTNAPSATQEDALASVKESLVNSWVRTLSPETRENLLKSRRVESLPNSDDNRSKRPVFNGHYVLVEPTGLKAPRIVLHSKDVADLLQLSTEQMESDDFLQWVSGNRVLGETWATPYSLSIMGTRYTSNCPYGTGDGYGDGRAISIGELRGYELQLKGAGKTPFHRGADGRAVLRSSIREFLASEAMHYLGIGTTRALSLVVSESDLILRPWYSGGNTIQIPSMDDPRLAMYPDKQKREILQQLRTKKADPNTMVREKAAITCRVASSFTRIGHLDLFARRAEQKSKAASQKTKKRYDTSTNEWKELEELVWHACYREFRQDAYDPFIEEKDIESAATVLLQKSAEQISTMVAGWIRVGFAQGNFNADNCLVGGKTMDYGPFGFLEEYSPLFAKWTGSGEHFGFLNQPSAGFANYGILVQSVVPVICAAQGDEDPDETVKEFMDTAAELFQGKTDETFRIKLGFEADQDVGDAIWESLEPLLGSSRTDWTIFFRQLTYIMKEFPDLSGADYEGMLALLEGTESSRPGTSAFYEPLTQEHRQQWLAWLTGWRQALALSTDGADSVYERMRLANPKFVLREWMLVDAYSDAAKGQEKTLRDMYNLIQHPCEEGSTEESERYYRRAPDEVLQAGGTAFMS